MKRALIMILALCLAACVLSSCSSKAPKHDEIDFSEVSVEDVEAVDQESDYVLITVKDYGDILIRLYPDVAPKTVKNFKNLVADGFYDGLIFHRVIENFMIQGGDPQGTGMGGADKTVEGEFSKNGFENNLRHVRGVVSMARSNDPDSASSQFFICHQGASHLDGNYAAFGFVVDGMDVVDAIAKVRTNGSDKPLDTVMMESVKFVEVK